MKVNEEDMAKREEGEEDKIDLLEGAKSYKFSRFHNSIFQDRAVHSSFIEKAVYC